MRKALIPVLLLAAMLVAPLTSLAQGGGASGQGGRGEGVGGGSGAPTSAPQGPNGSPVVPDPMQMRTQEQTCSESAECDLTRTREQDGAQAGETVRLRLQVCEEDCGLELAGPLARIQSWLRQRTPAFLQERLLRVTPFSMSGMAAVIDGELVLELESGNRWAREFALSDPAELVTEDAVIKAVYPDSERLAEIIDWDTLEIYLSECPESVVMVHGYVDEEGALVATSIKVQVHCSLA
ncbi:MAG: hypothetical protein GXX94_07640 [Chloroflexi bacterium]|nr:hypothetical protein [Chloroflexota bacterium]